MNVHAIAEIAKGYCLKNSGKLRDDIVSECESILESFDTIEKGILPRDISLLPVYSINELFGLGKKKYVEPSRQDYNKVVSISKKIISKYPTLKNIYTIDSYEILDDLSCPIMELNMSKINWSSNNPTVQELDEKYNIPSNSFHKQLKQELNKIGYELKTEGDDEYWWLWFYKTNKVNESYAIDLDSLKYTMRFKNLPLEEAVDLIKKTHNIDESTDICCIIPDNVTFYSEADFNAVKNTLLEAGVIPVVKENN